MIYPIKQFSGKKLDSIPYVLQEILEQAEMEDVFGAECFTLRPFFHKYAGRGKGQLITPYVSGIDGIKKFLGYFGISQDCVKEFRETGTLINLLHGNDYKKNGIVIGPLNKKRIWNRVESLFYDNESYFMIVKDKIDEGYLVNDPDGTPYFFMEEEFLQEIWNSTKGARIIINLGMIDKQKISYEEVWNCLRADIKTMCRRIQEEQAGSRNVFFLLSESIESKMRSSERIKLYYNLIELLNDGQAGMECFELNDFIGSSQQVKHAIWNLLAEYTLLVSDAMSYLLDENLLAVQNILLPIGKLEEQAVSYYLQL